MPRIQLTDCELYYEEHGHGPPLVCLHGGWQNTDSWQAQVDRFADDYRVVTFDLRGHGQTGPTSARRYSIELFADDLEQLLSRLDVERPIFCGVSIGGMIVQEYLSRHPNRARGAVIGGPLQSMPPVDLPPQIKPFLSPMPVISGMVSTIGSRATFQTLLGSISATTGGPWLSVDAAVRAQAMDAVGEVSPEEFRKLFRALYEFVPPDVAHVQTPTLVVYGDHEAPPVKVQGDRIARTVASGSVREIADAGHLVNQDQPAAFNSACAAFLESIRRPQPA